MRMLPLLAAIAAASPIAALPAQTAAPQSAPADAAGTADPFQPENDGSAAASATVPPGGIAPGVDPGTMSANAAVAGDIAAVKTVNATNRAQHAADMAAYDAAMRDHVRKSARYARQQRAYADAMAAWRIQVAACEKGKSVACNAPAPDPANFY